MSTDNKFNILDKVYHITPESPVGIVLDILYSFKYDEYRYIVVFGHSEQMTCVETELSNTKTFQ